MFLGGPVHVVYVRRNTLGEESNTIVAQRWYSSLDAADFSTLFDIERDFASATDSDGLSLERYQGTVP